MPCYSHVGCYKVNYDGHHYVNYQSAQQKCSGQGRGSLAIPRTKQLYEYLTNLVVSTGLIGKGNSLFKSNLLGSVKKTTFFDSVVDLIPSSFRLVVCRM